MDPVLDQMAHCKEELTEIVARCSRAHKAMGGTINKMMKVKKNVAQQTVTCGVVREGLARALTQGGPLDLKMLDLVIQAMQAMLATMAKNANDATVILLTAKPSLLEATNMLRKVRVRTHASVLCEHVVLTHVCPPTPSLVSVCRCRSRARSSVSTTLTRVCWSRTNSSARL